MPRTSSGANADNGNGQVVSQKSSSTTELQDFKNVTNKLIQDAEPSCGWNEYLEKMWVLKHYLDFTKRLSQQ